MKKNVVKLFNKGFTLIELLAIIVILALILMITIPKVLSMIETTDKESFKIVGENLMKATKQKVIDEMGDYGDGLRFKIEDGVFIGESIPMTGKLPKDAAINVTSEGKIILTMSNEKWCAKNSIDDSTIVVTKDPECVSNILEVVPEWCFYYDNFDSYISIYDYNYSCSKNPIIPDTIEGLPVLEISGYAFYDFGLVNVSIPDSVEYIGEEAFAYNFLTKIVLPNNLIGLSFGAFEFNKIKSVQFSNNIEYIEDGAFFSNQISSLTLPNSLSYLGCASFNDNQLPDEQAFLYQRNYDSSIDNSIIVSYGGAKRENVVVPNNVIVVGEVAFYNVSLKSVTLSPNTELIDYDAFSYNLLTSIVIPNSVAEMREGAFIYNNLTSVRIPMGLQVRYVISDTFHDAYVNKNDMMGGLFTSSCQDCTWTREGMYELPEMCFEYTETATNVTITGYDMASCSMYVKIPSTIGGKPVEHIGYRAFRAEPMMPAYDYKSGILAYNGKSNKVALTNQPTRKSIKEVEFPNTLISIKEEAFENNDQLISIIIPNSVQLIENRAFYSTTVTEIYLPSGVTLTGSIINNGTGSPNIANSYNTYYNKEAGLYVTYGGCEWGNVDSALPMPHGYCFGHET